MNNIAIIPARGGSKRIPKKNIKIFLGKPIIAYSIEAAKESGLFSEIMVSTDDKEIAKIAIQYGAKVPFLRSEKTSDDYATTFDVIKEVINSYKLIGQSFERACCIYPTSPLATPEKLINGFRKLDVQILDSVFPVVAFSYPVWRGLEVDDSGLIKMIWPEYRNCRSQDLKIVYHDAGQWYWFNIIKILEAGVLFTKRSGFIELLETEAQDIDNETDWKLAELKYKLLFEK